MRLAHLEVVECLTQELLSAGVLAGAETLFHCAHERLVEVAGEGRTRVVAEDADEHDGVVLHMRLLAPVLGEKGADLLGGGGGGGGRGFSGLDDDGQVQHLLAAARRAAGLAEEAHRPPRDGLGRVDGRIGKVAAAGAAVAAYPRRVSLGNLGSFVDLDRSHFCSGAASW